MSPAVTLPAVVELAFQPVLRLGDQAVRLETIALAGVLLVTLLLAAWVARSTSVDLDRPVSDRGAGDQPNRLRDDDLLYLAVAAVPGAVVGGRLGYALLHLDFFAANPGSLVDPSVGGLALSLAIPGGVLTACVVARLLGAPLGRWLHVGAVPVLVALAGGKAALVLGGDGQGLPSDLPWATAYAGPGPWGSLAPTVPSHPAQAYEALVTAVVLLVVAALLARGAFRQRDGRAFLVAVALWAAGRFLVAFTWRDAPVVGPLRVEQLLALGLVLGAVAWATLLERAARAGRDAGQAPAVLATIPDWPDPESRPRF